MLRYLLKRALGVPVTLLVLVTLSFFLIRLAPGGPFDEERALSPDVKANIMHAYHLDDPLYVQYFTYLDDLLHGDLGPSYKYHQWNVNQLLSRTFRVSLTIGSFAMLLAVLFGVTLGSLAALKKGSWLDNVLMLFSISGLSVPLFVTGPLLVIFFALYFQVLPVAGWGDWKSVVLPVVTLAVPQIAILARLMRGSMIEVLRSPFIRTARSKGLSSSTVILRHAFKPALTPVISYLGPVSAFVIAGSVTVEQVFALPGTGSLLIQAALNRDYTLVLGLVLVVGFILVLANFAVDIIYAFIDPRVRYGKE